MASHDPQYKIHILEHGIQMSFPVRHNNQQTFIEDFSVHQAWASRQEEQ